eukprot:g7578.t1
MSASPGDATLGVEWDYTKIVVKSTSQYRKQYHARFPRLVCVRDGNKVTLPEKLIVWVYTIEDEPLYCFGAVWTYGPGPSGIIIKGRIAASSPSPSVTVGTC